MSCLLRRVRLFLYLLVDLTILRIFTINTSILISFPLLIQEDARLYILISFRYFQRLDQVKITLAIVYRCYVSCLSYRDIFIQKIGWRASGKRCDCSNQYVGARQTVLEDAKKYQRWRKNRCRLVLASLQLVLLHSILLYFILLYSNSISYSILSL